MFIDNKYTKWYFSLMKMGSKTRPQHYSERHHIVPKSIGGSDSGTNLIYLNARQHYIAHLLLVKMTNGDQKRSMTYALVRFAGKNQKKGYKICSNLYASLRKEYSNSVSGKRNPMYGRPCYYKMTDLEVDIWKNNIKNGVTGEKNPFYNKNHSVATRAFISEKRSQPIMVSFSDGTTKTFPQYKYLGSHLGMSEHLGCKLCKPQYKHLWSKYNIENIEKI